MSTISYLDKTGLTYFWSKVKAIVTPKADKVTSPTNGDFAALDQAGNLTDSGKKASDFAPSDIGLSVVSGQVCQTYNE